MSSRFTYHLTLKGNLSQGPRFQALMRGDGYDIRTASPPWFALDVLCTTLRQILVITTFYEHANSSDVFLSLGDSFELAQQHYSGDFTQTRQPRPYLLSPSLHSKMPLTTSPTLLICTTCGTQYAAPLTKPPRHCRICDDPRQFVPPTGQSFTTLQHLYTSPQQYRNVFSSVPQDSKVTEIYTEPKFGIGQSARLIKTPEGNVLWDCVSLLDEGTVREIEGRGGLKAVVISHPHFYT